MVNKFKKHLTDKQQKVLEALESFILAHGYSPTIRHLGEMLHIASPSAVFKHILSLERKDRLRRVGGEIKLASQPAPGKAPAAIPLVGLVPAGHPREVFDVSEEAVDVPDWMIGRKEGNIFCTQVEGKSMVDAYIDDGDRILVERTNSASSGEMVVALLDDGSVTLKRLKLDKGRIFLMPENPEFEAIEVRELKILGRVIGVLRKY